MKAEESAVYDVRASVRDGTVDDEQAARELRRAVSRLHRRLRHLGPDDGMPLTKLSVLGQLFDRGPLAAGEIAVLERVQPQSLTRTFNDLEADGLVRRLPDSADGRKTQLELTAAGRHALAREMQPRISWLDDTMAAVLTPLEREVVRLATPLLVRLAEIA
jgi:DNA-binding MarR family transcriptional regulator